MGEEFDKSSSWFVCGWCSLASIINLGSSYVYGLFFPFILEEFQAGKAATAFVGSFNIAFLTVLGPVSSKLCQRFGCRIIMICGGLVSAGSILGSAFAPNIYILFLTYSIIFGIGSSLIYFAAIQIVPLYFDRYRSLATAFATVGPGAGLLVMSPVSQKLLEHFDWRTSLMILAAINLIPCILACTIKRRGMKNSDDEEDSKQHKKINLCSRYMQSMGISALNSKTFLIACVSTAVGILGYTMPSIHLAKYAEDLRIPIGRSSWMYFTIGICSLVSRILTGKLCDTNWITHIHIFQFAAVVFGTADYLLSIIQTFEQFMVYSMTYGICEGMLQTSMHCYILKSFQGLGFGWYMAIVGNSYLIGPVLAGLIADESGSYHPAFITAGALLFISACLPLLIKIVHKSDRPEEIKLNDQTDEEIIFEKMTVL